MSNLCTCHIDVDLCEWCRLKMTIEKQQEKIDQLKQINRELSGCLEWHISENERLEKELNKPNLIKEGYKPHEIKNWD